MTEMPDWVADRLDFAFCVDDGAELPGPDHDVVRTVDRLRVSLPRKT
ncbi:hypothetical protein [Burkholderia anthina]|nr:hypothetical protein [Burkholderia anthina]